MLTLKISTLLHFAMLVIVKEVTFAAGLNASADHIQRFQQLITRPLIASLEKPKTQFKDNNEIGPLIDENRHLKEEIHLLTEENRRLVEENHRLIEEKRQYQIQGVKKVVQPKVATLGKLQPKLSDAIGLLYNLQAPLECPIETGKQNVKCISRGLRYNPTSVRLQKLDDKNQAHITVMHHAKSSEFKIYTKDEYLVQLKKGKNNVIIGTLLDDTSKTTGVIKVIFYMDYMLLFTFSDDLVDIYVKQGTVIIESDAEAFIRDVFNGVAITVNFDDTDFSRDELSTLNKF